VDDDQDVREIVAELLTADGCSVAEAPGGFEALALLSKAEGRVDLVLTDVRMPGMDGIALSDALHARWPWMKVVFMTGYGGDALAAGGRIDPETPVLQKPFECETLLDCVHQALGKAAHEAAR
jgi:DNA-binding NtrC family response regulator